MPSGCRGSCKSKAGGASTHDSNFLPFSLLGWLDDQLQLVPGDGVDKTGGPLRVEYVVQARLVTPDTYVDILRVASCGFFHKVRIGEKRPLGFEGAKSEVRMLDGMVIR